MCASLCEDMKVYLLIRSLSVGGTERQLVSLASGLVEQGIDTKILVFYGGGRLYQTALNRGLDVIDLGKRGRWDFWFVFRLIQYVSSEKSSILYSFLTESNLCSLAIKLLRPKIKVVWGIRAVAPDKEIRVGDVFVAHAFKIAKALSTYPDLIVANSRVSRDQHIKEGFYPKRFKVITNGVSLDEFFCDPDAGLQQRAEWGVPRNCLLIGIVARLDPVKNHPAFLQAAALFRKQNPESRFVCVGNGPKQYKAQLLNLANGLNLKESLIWVENLTDLRGVYNAMDICTLCSFTESTPNVLLESMACGTLSVVSDVGGIRDSVGDHVTYLDPHNVRSVKDAWTSVAEMTPDIRGEARRQRQEIVMEKFSEQRMIAKTTEMLMSIVERPNSTT